MVSCFNHIIYQYYGCVFTTPRIFSRRCSLLHDAYCAWQHLQLQLGCVNVAADTMGCWCDLFEHVYQYVSICICIIYIYSVYIHIYIYASPPLRSTFDAFPETCMMKLTAYFNELCSEFDHENCVRSSKKQYPYNLQHVEHSSKHAVFFSEEVQFSSRKLFSLRSIIQYFFQNTRFLICSVWLTLSIAVKMCNGWCSLQHSLKRKIVVKGKCCVQVTICHEYKIVPWTALF